MIGDFIGARYATCKKKNVNTLIIKPISLLVCIYFLQFSEISINSLIYVKFL